MKTLIGRGEEEGWKARRDSLWEQKKMKMEYDAAMDEKQRQFDAGVVLRLQHLDDLAAERTLVVGLAVVLLGEAIDADVAEVDPGAGKRAGGVGRRRGSEGRDSN